MDEMVEQMKEVAGESTEPTRDVQMPSPTPALAEVKDKGAITMTEQSPQPDATTELDDATLLAINDAQNQFGTRVRRQDAQIREGSSETTGKPDLQPLSKKRPKSATSKTSSRKRPSKKPRLDSPVTSHRSYTPMRKSSKTPASRSTPLDAHSSSDEEEPESDPDDTNLYCICRKPDNHTWMIGCDGGCEDWFHGKCVGMEQADEPLLDRFICPNCEEKAVGVTTWKPMCRRDGCRNAARLKKGAESKYCSDECGRQFMQAKVKESGRVAHTTPKKRRRPAQHVDDENDAPVDLGPLGGPIRPHELAALTKSAPVLEAFKVLGNFSSTLGVTNPSLQDGLASGQDASPTEQKSLFETAEPDCNAEEVKRLAQIAHRKDELRTRRSLLMDREAFVGIVKAHAATNLEKQQCGFDPRLSWDDATFANWRASETGKVALSAGGDGSSVSAAAKSEHEDAAPKTDEEVEVCLRKRCHRHGPWQKLALQDVRFEEADVGDEMRRIDHEEKAIRARAMARSNGIVGSVTKTHGVGGGWVEVTS